MKTYILDDCLAKFYNGNLTKMDLVALNEERQYVLFNCGNSGGNFLDSPSATWSSDFKYLLECIDLFVNNPSRLRADQMNQALAGAYPRKSRNALHPTS